MSCPKWLAAALIAGLCAAEASAQFATTVQLPTFGVSVDAEGVLQVKAVKDPTGQLRAQKAAAAKAALAGDLAAASKLRKVSLTRLEQALRARLEAGQPPDDAMRHLAGLTRIEYVFCYPETKEILLAGPAEGWMADPVGRAVGLDSGRPIVLLEDLVVALRTYPPGGRGRPMVGCSIDPSQQGLQNLKAFQRKIPNAIRPQQRQQVAVQVDRGLRDALGLADIRVFGVPADTHFAEVLVEADYRMKMIGIGLEPPGIKLASYIDLVRGGTMGTLQRWWFVPNYDCVKLSDDGLGMQLVGQGVQLLSEDKLIGQQGQLAPGRKANLASDLFAQGFTKKYDELSQAKPIYAQLRNMIDLAMVAVFMQKRDIYGRAEWNLGALGEEKLLPVRRGNAPAQVPAAVRVLWKGNRMLAAAGGGVQIHPEKAFTAENLHKDADGSLGKKYVSLQEIPAEKWWWD